jgi:hypothetical protein
MAAKFAATRTEYQPRRSRTRAPLWLYCAVHGLLGLVGDVMGVANGEIGYLPFAAEPIGKLILQATSYESLRRIDIANDIGSGTIDFHAIQHLAIHPGHLFKEPFRLPDPGTFGDPLTRPLPAIICPSIFHVSAWDLEFSLGWRNEP